MHVFNKTTLQSSLTIMFDKDTYKMAADKKTHERVWEHKETLLLIEKWGGGGQEYPAPVKIMRKKKKPICLEIVAHLRAVGYEDRDDGSC